MDSTWKAKPRWTTERWRPIAGWEELYEVSDLGRVRRKVRVQKPGNRRFGKRLVRAQVDKNFELFVELYLSKKRKKLKVKKLVMAAFNRNYKGGIVHAVDGNNKNCRINNLREKGNLYRKRLSKEEISEIHKRLKSGERGVRLAEEFNVSRACICIIARKMRARDQETKTSESRDI